MLVWANLRTLALLAALGVLALSAGSSLARGQELKPTTLMLPEANVTAAWTGAGAVHLQAVRRDDSGQHHLRACVKLRPGEFPCFAFNSPPRSSVAKLLEPATPFAISLAHVFDPKISELTGFKNLHTLILKESAIVGKQQQALAELKQLRSLAVIRYGTDATLKALSALPNLETLEVHGNVTDAGIQAVSKLPKLHTLVLYDAQIKDKGWQALAAMKQLKTFHFRPAFATTVTDSHLRMLAEWSQLEALVLVDSADKNIDWKLISPLQELRVLELRAVPLTNKGLKDLTALQKLETFSFINFSETGLTTEGLTHLPAFPKLTSLRLAGNFLNDEGMETIGQLKQLTTLSVWTEKTSDKGLAVVSGLQKLRSLECVNGKISDAGLKALAGLDQLQHLSLSHTPISDAGLKELSGLKKLRTFHHHATKITPQGYLQLKKTLPAIDAD